LEIVWRKSPAANELSVRRSVVQALRRAPLFTAAKLRPLRRRVVTLQTPLVNPCGDRVSLQVWRLAPPCLRPEVDAHRYNRKGRIAQIASTATQRAHSAPSKTVCVRPCGRLADENSRLSI